LAEVDNIYKSKYMTTLTVYVFVFFNYIYIFYVGTKITQIMQDHIKARNR